MTIPLGEPLAFAGHHYLVSGRGNHTVGPQPPGGRAEAFRVRDIEAQKRVQVADAHRPKVGHSIHRSLAEIPDPADHGVFEIQPADSKTPAS